MTLLLALSSEPPQRLLQVFTSTPITGLTTVEARKGTVTFTLETQLGSTRCVTIDGAVSCEGSDGGSGVVEDGVRRFAAVVGDHTLSMHRVTADQWTLWVDSEAHALLRGSRGWFVTSSLGRGTPTRFPDGQLLLELEHGAHLLFVVEEDGGMGNNASGTLAFALVGLDAQGQVVARASLGEALWSRSVDDSGLRQHFRTEVTCPFPWGSDGVVRLAPGNRVSLDPRNFGLGGDPIRALCAGRKETSRVMLRDKGFVPLAGKSVHAPRAGDLLVTERGLASGQFELEFQNVSADTLVLDDTVSVVRGPSTGEWRGRRLVDVGEAFLLSEFSTGGHYDEARLQLRSDEKVVLDVRGLDEAERRLLESSEAPLSFQRDARGRWCRSAPTLGAPNLAKCPR